MIFPYKYYGNIPAKEFTRKIYIFIIICIFLCDMVVCGFALYAATSTFSDELSSELSERSTQINNMLNENIDRSNSVITNNYILQNISVEYDTLHEKQVFSGMLSQILDAFTTTKTGVGNSIVIYTDNASLPQSESIRGLEDIGDEETLNALLKLSGEEIYWDNEISTYNNKQYIKLYRNFSNKANKLIFELSIDFREFEYFTMNTFKDYITVSYSKPNFAKNNVKYVKLINGMTLYTSIPKSVYIQKIAVILFINFALLIIIYILTMLIANTILSDSFRELDRIIDIIKHNTEDILNDGEIEINSGNNGVKIIKDKIVDLLKQNRRLHIDYTKMQNEKHKSDLKVLQMKINPHLIYNSLSAVKWNVLKNHDMHSAQIIDSLIKYYRHALNHDSDIVTVSDEINMVSEYLKLMSVVRSNNYQLVKEIGEDCGNCGILKMLLQPVAENSVLHAFGNNAESIINIKVFKENGYLYIKISDNGCGMSAEKELELNRTDLRPSVHYGIKNIKDRIYLYYGEDCGISVSSSDGEGTSVTFKLHALDKNA